MHGVLSLLQVAPAQPPKLAADAELGTKPEEADEEVRAPHSASKLQGYCSAHSCSCYLLTLRSPLCEASMNRPTPYQPMIEPLCLAPVPATPQHTTPPIITALRAEPTLSRASTQPLPCMPAGVVSQHGSHDHNSVRSSLPTLPLSCACRSCWPAWHPRRRTGTSNGR
jgi:hypothetical protein